MEVVGAAASFIAIGQALIAGRHVVNLLQEIPKIGNELAWLNNEIESLRAAVDAAVIQGAASLGDKPEPPYLKQARIQIVETAKGLDSIRLRCTRPGKDGKLQPRKMKWFILQKELRECRDKVRDARGHFQLALTLDLKNSLQLALCIDGLAVKLASTASITSTPVSESHSELDSKNETFQEQTHEKAIQDFEPEMKQLVLLDDDYRANKPNARAGLDMVIFKAKLSMASSCKQPCQCRCHASRPPSIRSSPWARSMIGSFFMTFSQQMFSGTNANCTEPACKGNRHASATFEYRFPTWLCSYYISMRVSKNNFYGLGASLRPIRIISSKNKTWLAIENRGMTGVQHAILEYGPLYPNDRDMSGLTMLERVIHWASSDVVEFMIEFWAQSIQKETYDPVWCFEANYLLENESNLPPQKAAALRLVASFGESVVDAAQTRVHQAAGLTDNMEIREQINQAVSHSPWVIDQWNHEGCTPLIVASMNGNISAVKELIHLNCNIDLLDYHGRTALMEAARNGHTNVVQYLLDAGCSVDTILRSDRTALRHAVDPNWEPLGDPGCIVAMLLAAGASTMALGAYGDSVICDLSSTSQGEGARHAMRTRLRLLLDAGLNINIAGFNR